MTQKQFHSQYDQLYREIVQLFYRDITEKSKLDIGNQFSRELQIVKGRFSLKKILYKNSRVNKYDRLALEEIQKKIILYKLEQ